MLCHFQGNVHILGCYEMSIVPLSCAAVYTALVHFYQRLPMLSAQSGCQSESLALGLTQKALFFSQSFVSLAQESLITPNYAY